MVLELVGGAVVGAIAGELLKVVLDAKQKASAFQPALARLESTLKVMIPRLDQIGRLNSQLNLHHTEMEELVSLIINGRALVVKCSKISTVNLVKKVQYSKELLDLDNSLFRYFVIILPLDRLKDTKEILVVVKELQMKLVGNHKDGGIHQSESAGTHKEDSASAAPEVVELLLVHANDAQFQGIKLFREGLYKEALLHYDLALHLAPDQMPATKDLRSTCHANRAICFLKMGKYEHTICECNKALELNPDYTQALMKRGEAHENLQHFDEAIADMETSILKLEPTDVQSKRTKVILMAAVRRLEMKLVDDKVDGTICNKDAADNVASKADVILPNGDSNGGLEGLVGALLGAVAGELLRAILHTKEQASNFQPMFKRLEATLNSIIPRLDEIRRLNLKLDIQQAKKEELIAIVNDGTTLVFNCSKVSRINYFKKVRYRKELSDLDDNLKNY